MFHECYFAMFKSNQGLTNYFLRDNNKEKIINNNIELSNKNDHQLSPVYLELIHNLWDINGNKSFEPYNFMNKINELNPLFKKGQAGDSKDFIIYILEQIHKELKRVNANNSNSIINIPLDQYDKKNTLNHFFSDFQGNCSVISDLFFGIVETTNECQNCKNNYNAKGLDSPICYNYQVFNCLIFPLEEVKNWKINNNIMQNYNNIPMNNVVSLNDCFNYYQKSVLFNGENKNFCNICNQYFDSIYTTKI